MRELLHRIILLASLLAVPAAPVFFGLAASPLRAEGFLAALDDVPVMPGMTEDASATVAFDTAAGRIVTARIKGRVRAGLDVGALLSFYAASLPALGWRAESPTRFLRDGETLVLRAQAQGGELSLVFELRPN